MKKAFTILLFLLVGLYPLSSAPVELSCSTQTITAYQGEKILLNLKVKNNLNENLRPADQYFLSYHLYDRKGNLISFNNRRFILPVIIKKKHFSHFTLPIYFDYDRSGLYRVEFDLVKEGEFWGAARGWKTCRFQLDLKELISSEFKNRYLKTFYSTDIPILNKEQYVLRITLKNCEIIKDNRIWGFSTGSLYPQIWIRDTSTFIAYAKHHYPLKIFQNMVELFFAHQQDNGEIADWIDISGKSDKNTVSSDQESSMVMAAYEIAIEQSLWLKKKIRGKTITERLEMALTWVWKKRRDPEWNLIYSGLTADWGDVDNSYPDQRATKMSDRSTLVFSTYTQAKYLQAMEKLLFIFSHLKKYQKVDIWKKRHRVIRKQTLKHLYLKDRGYFIIHICPTSDRHLNIEKEILPIGGNAEAILAGLMSPKQIRKFLRVLKQKRKTYGLPNICFTLLPPYPEGFFSHPALSIPWHYQNGGQWDWIGAKLVKAMFLSNFRQEAKAYLLEIASKNIANFGIFEWEDRGGNPLWSSMFYVGAAGVIGDAILNGYFGYRSDFDHYRLDQTDDHYRLSIHKRDQFTITRNKGITIDIQQLRKKSILFKQKFGGKTIRLNKIGTHKLDDLD
jgi:hypothetical protein